MGRPFVDWGAGLTTWPRDRVVAFVVFAALLAGILLLYALGDAGVYLED